MKKQFIFSNSKWHYKFYTAILLVLIFASCGNNSQINDESQETLTTPIKNNYKCEADLKHFYDNGVVWIQNLKGKWGAIQNSKIVIDFKYDNCSNFQNGIAWVKANNKWGSINLKDKIISPFENERLIQFDTNILLLKKNGKWKFKYWNNQKYPYDEEFEDLVYYSDRFIVINKANLLGAINLKGNQLIPFIYREIIYDEELETICVKSTEEKWGGYDLNKLSKGLIFKPIYNKIAWVSSTIAAIYEGDRGRYAGNWHLINDQEESVSRSFSSGSNCWPDFAPRKKHSSKFKFNYEYANGWGLMDEKGNQLFYRNDLEDLKFLNENFIWGKTSQVNSSVILDINGNTISTIPIGFNASIGEIISVNNDKFILESLFYMDNYPVSKKSVMVNTKGEIISSLIDSDVDATINQIGDDCFIFGGVIYNKAFKAIFDLKTNNCSFDIDFMDHFLLSRIENNLRIGYKLIDKSGNSIFQTDEKGGYLSMSEKGLFVVRTESGSATMFDFKNKILLSGDSINGIRMPSYKIKNQFIETKSSFGINKALFYENCQIIWD